MRFSICFALISGACFAPFFYIKMVGLSIYASGSIAHTALSLSGATPHTTYTSKFVVPHRKGTFLLRTSPLL